MGPDYIDPGYHALATGRPGRNLDPYLCGTGRIAPLFLHGAAGADLAVVEGVMGLFDGASGQGELASTAQVAKLLRAPVVLVVDASSQSRSVAALVHGFASWDPEVRLAGVILNKVGSDRHEAMLREAMEIVRGAGARRPAAYPAGPYPVAASGPGAGGRAAGRTRWRRCANSPRGFARAATSRRCSPWRTTCRALTDTPWDPAAEVAPVGGAAAGAAPAAGAAAGKPLIAVAGGAAFTFSYAEHAELLAAAGAEVAPFDPLHDEQLPPGTQGLVIGGGFPEVYAPDLSANAPLRAAVAALAASGAPVSAECAGLLYLSRSIDGKPMCGVLPADARMTERLTLGYREAVALQDNALAAAGTRVRGHEFHRTTLQPGAGASPAWGLTHPERRVEGFVSGGVHASYLHVHWAAEPSLAGRLVESAAQRTPSGAPGGAG